MHGAIRAICSCLMDGRVGEAADLDAFETAQHRFIEHLAHFKTLAVTQEAQIDALTGLPLRHRIAEDFVALDSFARRHGGAPVVMMLDVDHFKQFNDRHGHAGGDVVLRELAALMRKTLRDVDKVYRYGGEEFLLLMDSDGIAGAQIAVQRMLQSVRELSVALPGGESMGVTATIGVAVAAPDESLASVIERADKALYAGKAAGRDRWILSQQE
jgi:diguanylate cyclase (GGDEF)-like protein